MAIHRIGKTVEVTIPAWLYELLPFIYLASGLLAATKLKGSLAIASGALLIAAGIQVLRMRGRYRKAMREPYRVTVRSRG